jgi:hypothetical protein
MTCTMIIDLMFALYTRYTLSDLDLYIMTLSKLGLKGIFLLSYLNKVKTGDQHLEV